MRVAHFDCFSGISGDMTLGALIDAGVPSEIIADGLASLGLPIRMTVERQKRNGLVGTRVLIVAPDEESHRYLPDIEAILSKGKLTEAQFQLAMRIFRRLGEAEAAAHGVPIEKVHFHEVGALDSIADIAGAAIGLDWLKIDRFTSRSVPPGSGTVKCAHGIMPIPTPATARLLVGVPMATSVVKGELTTPTGAAILTTVVSQYTDSPQMTIDAIGYGAGYKDFWEQPNLLRLLIGTAPDHSPGESPEQDRIWLLETNLDDLPAEILSYCSDRLFQAGAVDVFSTPITMKKSRPGILFSVLVPPQAVAACETILFEETGTFGIRRVPVERTILQREIVTVQTPYGPLTAKRGFRSNGFSILTPEFESAAQLAQQHQVPLRLIYQSLPRE
ncbi:nickel pincer cofactor biosynthesis protein LarC [Tuwongella immobilis]|uniref:Putative nickel insertion protein n=1 Tax=Tuwongella immobilis TaxID=692036 RepID=A0A6C2YJ45_9BACT|nr:nickel pincer cofactor biosynthesis protein LarC [Tuwongella immobilis]VIP01384.1 UPF0272 protein HGMM_F07G10C11 OS=uncultured planctomycete GN=HGMM_F07G10C11 PE=3 SV=1: DUF111 [Tuwongella immobilis]VTR98245.1 UPF0272 protein HGMM_F07G10C11 OS=uncultured planctomycete GN=HGMM_F07G10C11 PE=3 SV=1: DUF111 [Tuwongella immobilis]